MKNINNKRDNRGFIQLIVILVLIVIILSLLGISLRALFANPTLQDNFGFVGTWTSAICNSYLAAPFRILYTYFLKPVGERFLHALQNINFDIPTPPANP